MIKEAKDLIPGKLYLTEKNIFEKLLKNNELIYKDFMKSILDENLIGLLINFSKEPFLFLKFDKLSFGPSLSTNWKINIFKVLARNNCGFLIINSEIKFIEL